MYCPYCGADNVDGSRFCRSCGKELLAGPRKTSSHPHPSNQWENSAKVIVGVAIVAIIIILAALALPVQECTLKVTVRSTHLLYSVDYVLYVDGEQRATGTLAPGESIIWTMSYHFPLLPSSKEIVISATSTGGGFGTQTDIESLPVADGNVYYVTLTI